MKTAAAATLLMTCFAIGPAWSAPNDTIYRCGNSYSQSPCAGARAIDADDARSSEQRAEARRVAAEQRRLGDQMERDRLKHEAAQQPAFAVGFDSRSAPLTQVVHHVNAYKKVKAIKLAAAGKDFVAIAPNSIKLK